jgi:serine/threonine protein kinase
MHKQGYFHRDLKPENLLAHGDKIKIGDFGLAREIRSRPPYTDYVSTRWYRAPEILLKSPSYNSPIDIFALGTIMAELYTMRPLFPGANEHDQMMKICALFGTPTNEEWPDAQKLATKIGFIFPKFERRPLETVVKNTPTDAIDLMQCMMRYDPIKRYTATECLAHSYFNDMQTIVPEKSSLMENKPNLFTFKGNPYESKYAHKMSREKSREKKPIDANPYENEKNNDVDQMLSSMEKNMFAPPKNNQIPASYGLLPTIKPAPIVSTFTYGKPSPIGIPFNKYAKENFGYDNNYIISNVIKQPIQKYVSETHPEKPTYIKQLEPLNFDYQKKIPIKNLEDHHTKKYLEPLLLGKQFNGLKLDYKYKA